MKIHSPIVIFLLLTSVCSAQPFEITTLKPDFKTSDLVVPMMEKFLNKENR